uniref:Uncharacterized protein n=1 Tax=Anguilla anguilla TaxID=7936 RepID=A0A0E9TKB1_ANGAN
MSGPWPVNELGACSEESPRRKCSNRVARTVLSGRKQRCSSTHPQQQ